MLPIARTKTEKQKLANRTLLIDSYCYETSKLNVYPNNGEREILTNKNAVIFFTKVKCL